MASNVSQTLYAACFLGRGDFGDLAGFTGLSSAMGRWHCTMVPPERWG